MDAARRDLESVQIPEPSEPSGPVSAPRASSKGGEEGDDRGDGERWIDELPPNHLMTHLPKSRLCDTCLQAKLYESPHRRRENQRAVLKEARGKEDPKEHLEKIAVDFAIASDLVGQTGDKAALVLVDKFSGLLGIYPCEDRSTEECMKGLQHFCGTKAPGVVEVASDREGGILKAVKSLGFVADPAAPNMKIKNAVAEAAIRTVKGSASALLLHAGFQPDLWPLAVKYLEFSYNINTMSKTPLEPPVTCYEAAHGYPYEGYMIPFGALVWYKESGGKSFEPKGSPAIYLGPELINGMKYKGNHRVWALNLATKGILRECVVRTLAFPNGKWQFPLKPQGKPEGLVPPGEVFEPPPDLGDILVDEGEIAVETNPKDEGRTPNPKRRNRSITTIRIGIHGPTPKCFGCKEGTYNHTQTCRDRFNELIDTCEPSSKGKSLSSSAHVGEMPSKTVPAPPSSSPAHPAGGSGEGQKDIAVSPSSSPARLAGGGW